MKTADSGSLEEAWSGSIRPTFWLFFFQVTTKLQYIEDSEPVVDSQCMYSYASGSVKRTRIITYTNILVE